MRQLLFLKWSNVGVCVRAWWNWNASDESGRDLFKELSYRTLK